MLNSYDDHGPAVILVVDDDMVIRLMLQKLLEDHGHRIVLAENGQLALEAFQQHRPDLVLMDASMPVLDGFNACREIKQLPYGKDTPILMITALYDDDSVDQAFSAGAMEYITKPIHLAALRHRVDTLLKARRAEIDLARSEARFRGVFEQSSMGIALVSGDGKVIVTNAAMQKILGRGEEALQDIRFDDLFHSVGGKIEQEFRQQLLRNERDGYQMEKYFQRPPHDLICWASLTTSLVSDEQGEPKFFVYMAEDISERKQAQIRQRIALKVFEHTTDGIMITDARGRITYVNHAFTLVTGYTYEEALDKTPDFLRSDEHEPAFYEKLWDSVQHGGHWSGEIWNRRRNGEVYSEWLAISAVRGEHNEITNFVAVYSDITALREGSEEVKRLTQFDARFYRLTRYDVLTDLPNRLLFHERLTRACREGVQVALLCIDLEGFNALNESLGYEQGDVVLKQVAQRLRRCARDADAVARLENDEFAMIIAPLAQNYDASLMAERIIAALHEPLDLGDHDIQLHCHIGIGLYAGGESPPEEVGKQVEYLLQRAELGMYLARQENVPDRYRVYEEEVAA